MRYFSGSKRGKVVVVRLEQNDDILLSIKKVLEEENIRSGVVVSGIGTVDQNVLHMVTTTGYPPLEYFDHRRGQALEVVSIQGYIADGTPHLHMMISDSMTAVGGHLEEGCRILYLGEIVIEELPDLRLRRVRNEQGISLLQD